MRHYKRFQASQLPGDVGTNLGGSRLSDGTEGFLSFGPYLQLEPGNYTAGFYLKRLDSCPGALVYIDATCGGGTSILAAREVAVSSLLATLPGFVKLNFVLGEGSNDVEVRLRASSDANFEIRELVVFRQSLG